MTPKCTNQFRIPDSGIGLDFSIRFPIQKWPFRNVLIEGIMTKVTTPPLHPPSCRAVAGRRRFWWPTGSPKKRSSEVTKPQEKVQWNHLTDPNRWNYGTCKATWRSWKILWGILKGCHGDVNGKGAATHHLEPKRWHWNSWKSSIFLITLCRWIASARINASEGKLIVKSKFKCRRH